jgi:hypothetical protein
MSSIETCTNSDTSAIACSVFYQLDQLDKKFDSEYNDWECFDEFLSSNMTKQNANNFLKTLHECKCCTIHQLNKPLTYEDIDLNQQPKLNIKVCKCKCRSYSRWICRAYPTMKD